MVLYYIVPAMTISAHREYPNLLTDYRTNTITVCDNYKLVPLINVTSYSYKKKREIIWLCQYIKTLASNVS